MERDGMSLRGRAKEADAEHRAQARPAMEVPRMRGEGTGARSGGEALAAFGLLPIRVRTGGQGAALSLRGARRAAGGSAVGAAWQRLHVDVRSAGDAALPANAGGGRGRIVERAGHAAVESGLRACGESASRARLVEGGKDPDR